MPQTKKLAWAELRVGLMALASISILVVLIFLLTGKGGWFRKTAVLKTYVDDSASLKVGVPVRLNGIDIGSVRSVGLSPFTDAGRTIEVVMDIRQEMVARIPADSQASINPEGVFGDKYVNIRRGQGAAAVADGGEIKSLDTTEFHEIVNSSYATLSSLQGITKRMDGIMAQVEKGRGTIGKLLYDETLYNRIDSVVVQAHDVVAAVADGKGTIGKLLADDSIYTQTGATLRRVDTMLAGVQAGNGTLGMLLNDPGIYQNANRLVAEANKVVDGVSAGQGTLGKLLKDEALYKQVNATLGKVDTTIDRANSGQGTLGQLLVNRALYDSLTGMTSETQQLIKDIRANPKKFLRIKLALF